MKQLKLAGSSVRGVVGNGFTPELAADFACAFGTWAGGREVVLARDTRRSSPLFASAARAGLLSTGCDVADAGICPTPVAQHLVRRRGASGGIVVTGSHNDSSWNAFKFINAQGGLLDPIQGEEVLDIYHLGEFAKAAWDRLGKVRALENYAQPYLEDVLGGLNLEAIRGAAFQVVVDAGNGAAGPLIGPLLDYLGCKAVLINGEANGDFAHGPSPTPANMRQLACLLRHVDADAGFAINSDADSVGIVTEKGEPLSEECTFPIAADHLLKSPGEVTITNFSTSMMIEHVVRRRGGRLLRTKIGEGNVLFAAANENATLAGEGSGGVAYMPVVRAFDAFHTLARVLEAMAVRGEHPSGLRAKIPSFAMKKGVVPAPPDRVYYALEEIRLKYRGGDLDLTDGVRVSFAEGWLHVRASNTEPVIRVIAESADEDSVERLFQETMRSVYSVVHGRS